MAANVPGHAPTSNANSQATTSGGGTASSKPTNAANNTVHDGASSGTTKRTRRRRRQRRKPAQQAAVTQPSQTQSASPSNPPIHQSTQPFVSVPSLYDPNNNSMYGSSPATYNYSHTLHAGGATSKKPHDAPMSTKELYYSVRCGMVRIGTSPTAANYQSPDNGGTSACAVGRVTLVSWDGSIVLDTLVKVPVPIGDYQTSETGITHQGYQTATLVQSQPPPVATTTKSSSSNPHLDPTRPPQHPTTMVTFEHVRKSVAQLIKGKVLIGHGIEVDLQALGLHHPSSDLRDTANYTPYMMQHSLVDNDDDGGGGIGSTGHSMWLPRDLKSLFRDVLHKEPRQSDIGDPIYDAACTMELYKVARTEWETHLIKLAQQKDRQRQLVLRMRSSAVGTAPLSSIQEHDMFQRQQVQEQHYAPDAVSKRKLFTGEPESAVVTDYEYASPWQNHESMIHSAPSSLYTAATAATTATSYGGADGDDDYSELSDVSSFLSAEGSSLSPSPFGRVAAGPAYLRRMGSGSSADIHNHGPNVHHIASSPAALDHQQGPRQYSPPAQYHQSSQIENLREVLDAQQSRHGHDTSGYIPQSTSWLPSTTPGDPPYATTPNGGDSRTSELVTTMVDTWSLEGRSATNNSPGNAVSSVDSGSHSKSNVWAPSSPFVPGHASSSSEAWNTAIPTANGRGTSTVGPTRTVGNEKQNVTSSIREEELIGHLPSHLLADLDNHADSSSHSHKPEGVAASGGGGGGGVSPVTRSASNKSLVPLSMGTTTTTTTTTTTATRTHGHSFGHWFQRVRSGSSSTHNSSKDAVHDTNHGSDHSA